MERFGEAGVYRPAGTTVSRRGSARLVGVLGTVGAASGIGLVRDAGRGRDQRCEALGSDRGWWRGNGTSATGELIGVARGWGGSRELINVGRWLSIGQDGHFSCASIG
jgi:hypothetical protein